MKEEVNKNEVNKNEVNKNYEILKWMQEEELKKVAEYWNAAIRINSRIDIYAYEMDRFFTSERRYKKFCKYMRRCAYDFLEGLKWSSVNFREFLYKAKKESENEKDIH